MRRERVPVRVPPRPVLAGDGQLALDRLVVRPELLVGDRPVGADAVAGAGPEVRRMKAWAVAGVVDHRPADAAARVVLAHLDRVGAADDPLLVPVQRVRAGLVGDPVLVGMPERAGLDDHDPPPGAGQALSEHRSAGSGADDAQVDLVGVVVAAMVSSPGRSRRCTSSRKRESLSLGPIAPLSRSRITAQLRRRADGILAVAPGSRRARGC